MPLRLHRLRIPLAALLAVLPLLLHGPSCGHDFDFHLLNWLEATSQLRHLGWPHWAYTPAYNAGEPRFLFYPPLSWLLGAALTQVLPFPLVPIAFTFIALAAAGFALHSFAAPYTTPQAATLAAVLYLLNPYMLFTAYERTAYAELLAAAFIPLLLSAILAPRPTARRIALPLALLWLTNAPAAVMSSYALALLAALRLLQGGDAPGGPTRPELARTSILGTGLGLALAAFYIVPAALERKWVQISMAVIPGMSPVDNFLFHHTALTPGISPDDAFAHDTVLHTASVIAVLLLTLTAIALFAAFFAPHPKAPFSCRSAAKRRNLLLLSALAAAIAFLLTPLSLPVWNHTPQLAFLQFPWRLLALLVPILAFATALAFRHLRRPLTLVLAATALCAALIPAAWRTFDQACDPPDTPTARAALFHSPQGTEPTDEYTPVDADPDALHPEDPPYWLLPPSAPIDTPAPPGAPPGPVPNHLTLTLPSPETLILNRRQFPLWRIELNHRLIQPDNPGRTDGLIALALPAGRDTLELSLRETPDEIAGLALSGLAWFALLARRRRHPVHSSSAESIRT
jgi:hypothetical protein